MDWTQWMENKFGSGKVHIGILKTINHNFYLNGFWYYGLRFTLYKI